ncbi:MAG: hypothetical protein K8V42_05400 [Enterococcus aquimarinus]|uniref:Uncharacterized protein n=1 Tax=Enterococcus aquimarinus TaxID=328396 RepID=A0A9E3ZZ77_9ENTE|nr:hypothetical protein [Enterococcus aquimarinus]
MQLSLFESYGALEFNGTILKKDWSYEFKPGTKDIVINNHQLLTKEELLLLVSKSVKSRRAIYGYNIYYTDSNGVNKDLFIRFINETTKAKQSVSEFIEKHFDNLVEKEARR